MNTEVKRMLKRGDFLWLAALLSVTAFLVIPGTHRLFVSATAAQPYLMGFVKFALLATMGELLAVRIVTGGWQKLPGLILKILVWGIIGMLIVLMFQIYTSGVAGAVEKHLLWTGSGWPARLLTAFLTSAVMNLTFGPAFMAAHRISDTWIEARAAGQGLSLAGAVDRIDWPGFFRFVVGKTIPIFWIPAHTITFLLPPAYRVMMAAYLSIALGVTLAFAKRKAAVIT